MKPSQPGGNGASVPVPDIVRRAAAILAQQAPLRSALPGLDPTTGSGYPIPPPPMLSLDEMRQRALQLVSDFFASFGPSAALAPALLNALSSSYGGALPSPAGGQGLPGGAPGFPPGGMSGFAAPESVIPGLSTLLWQSAPAPTRAGQSVMLPLQAENRQSQPVRAGYYSSDLLSDSGRAIPAYQVSFEPPSFDLRPGERTPVNARIQVPLQTTPGAYSGLVQAAGLPDSKAVLTIHVV